MGVKMEILNFIFKDFWHFIGVCLLLDLTIGNIFRCIINNRKIKCLEKLSERAKTIEDINILTDCLKDKEDK